MIPSVLFSDFQERSQARAAEARLPLSATIEFTYGCNLNCVHCYNPTHIARDELKTAEVLSILDQLAELGTQTIDFTGGEFFTRGDWYEILSYARGKGFVFSLITNGTLIDKEVADLLKRVQPLFVNVSLYGVTQQSYERVTRVRGSFQRFLQGVRILKEKGLPLRLKSMILTPNEHEVDEMRRFSEGLGVKFEYCTNVSPRVTGSQEPLRYRISPERDFEIWRKYVADPTLEKGLIPPVRDGERGEACDGALGPFNCACGKNKLVITPYGKMNLCVQVYFPQKDVTDMKVAPAWQSLVGYVQNAAATPSFECPACPVYNECARTPASSWLEMGDVNACVPEHKSRARLRQEYLDSWTSNLQGQRGSLDTS